MWHIIHSKSYVKVNINVQAENIKQKFVLSYSGSPITKGSLRNFKLKLATAGSNRIETHALRHTYVKL